MKIDLIPIAMQADFQYEKNLFMITMLNIIRFYALYVTRTASNPRANELRCSTVRFIVENVVVFGVKLLNNSNIDNNHTNRSRTFLIQ